MEHPLQEALSLKERFGAERFDKLKSMTLDTMQSMMAEMRTALEAGGREDLQRQAHSFKSSAANYGADRLSQKAAELEEVFKDGIPDDVEAHMIELQNLVDDFLAVLKVL